jgi:hypothetical protein
LEYKTPYSYSSSQLSRHLKGFKLNGDFVNASRVHRAMQGIYPFYSKSSFLNAIIQ